MFPVLFGAGGGVVGLGTILQAGSNPYEVTEFFNLPNPSSRTMAPGSTHPLTEITTRKLSGGKSRLACKTDFTIICDPIM
jgi:hypothetical protein